MKHTITILCIVFLSATTAAAEGEVPSTPLILHPAAAPTPALKYALLPELRDTIPGNAVTHYRQAIQILKQDGPPKKGREEQVDQWMKIPLKDLPREEVGKFLKQCETTFQEVEAGARSEQCEWELTEKLRKTGDATPLPDVQEMRAAFCCVAWSSWLTASPIWPMPVDCCTVAPDISPINPRCFMP